VIIGNPELPPPLRRLSFEKLGALGIPRDVDGMRAGYRRLGSTPKAS